MTMAQGHPRARPVSMETFGEIDLDEAFAFYQGPLRRRQRLHLHLRGGPSTWMKSGPWWRPTWAGSPPSTGRRVGGIWTWTRPPGVIRKEVRRGVEPQSQTQIIFTGPFDYTPENRLGMRAMTGGPGDPPQGTHPGRVGRQLRGGGLGELREGPGRGFFGCGSPSGPTRIASRNSWTPCSRRWRISRETAATPEELQAVKEQETEGQGDEPAGKTDGGSPSSVSPTRNGADPRILLDNSLLAGVTAETIRADALRYLPVDNYVMVSLFPEASRVGTCPSNGASRTPFLGQAPSTRRGQKSFPAMLGTLSVRVPTLMWEESRDDPFRMEGLYGVTDGRQDLLQFPLHVGSHWRGG